MDDKEAPPSFRGDTPIAAVPGMLRDRRELALVAIERTRMPMVITNPREPDGPIVYANEAFLDLTGYSADEVLGRNCRFLQGEQTDRRDIDAIRSGIDAGLHCVETELLNYRKDGSSFWNQLAISPVHDDAGELLYYFASQKDVTARRQAQALEISERLLLKEVDHRALNALTLVKSIVSLSGRASIEQFADAVTGRVDALARAHRLLALGNWSSVALRELLIMELKTSAVDYSGPAILLASRLVQPLCLVIHELATNARRHGALASPAGALSISWQEVGDELSIRWAERGSAETPPGGRGTGLGMSLIRGIVEKQLAGRLTMDWAPDGLQAEIRVPSAT